MIAAAEASRNVAITLQLVAGPGNQMVAKSVNDQVLAAEKAATKASIIEAKKRNDSRMNESKRWEQSLDVFAKAYQESEKKRSEEAKKSNKAIVGSIDAMAKKLDAAYSGMSDKFETLEKARIEESKNSNAAIIAATESVAHSIETIWTKMEKKKTDITTTEINKRIDKQKKEQEQLKKLDNLNRERVESNRRATEAGVAALQGTLDLVEGAAILGLTSEENFEKFARGFIKVQAGFKVMKGFSLTKLIMFNNIDGFFDNAGIADVLTISEVQSLYNSGNGQDYPFPSTGNNEVQTLSLSGSPTAGNVTVSYQGEGVDIPYDATASEAEDLLDTISTLGSGNVNVTGGAWPGTALVVEFINDLAVTDVELLEIDTSSLVMSVTETAKGVAPPAGEVATEVTPLTQSTTTPNSGPNNWDVAANWHTNTVPVTGDTVYLTDSDISILYGLDQSAVTLAALHIEQTFTGFVGLPRTNTDTDGSSYFEYREQYLKISATELFIGDKEGDGSRLMCAQ